MGDGKQIYKDFRDQIAQRAQIEEVVSSYGVELRNLTALCPLPDHKDTRKSFHVKPDASTWHCFGCNQGGSVFDFVMLMDGLEFTGARDKLAAHYHIPIPRFEPEDLKKATRSAEIEAFLFHIIETARTALPADDREYLLSRGMTEKAIKEFKLGLMPEIRTLAYKNLSKTKLIELGIDAGVLGEKGGEFMLGRIICSGWYGGRVIQISGRATPEEEEKHRDEVDFKKYVSMRNTPYRMHAPINVHRMMGKTCELVEGYMDMILCEMEGISAAATCGTAFMSEWVRYCGKKTKFTCAYDCDPNLAGQRANIKVGGVLYDDDRQVKVRQLPMGEDPGSILPKHKGRERYLKLPVTPYLTAFIEAQEAEPDDYDKQDIVRACFAKIGKLALSIQDAPLVMLAKRYNLPANDVRRDMKVWAKAQKAPGTDGPMNRPWESGDESSQSTPEEETDDLRPVIYVDTDDLEAFTARAWDAFHLANQREVRYFRKGNQPCRLPMGDNRRQTLAEMDKFGLRYELVRIARCVERVGKDQREKLKAPSDEQLQDMQATPDIPLPLLDAIAETPVFAADGTLLTKPGYHPASLTYYAPVEGLVLRDVSPEPTGEDILSAMEIFQDIVHDAPWKEIADRTHAFCLWLLPFLRQMIPGPTPFHMIESAASGSGKGLLMSVLLYPAMGNSVGRMTQAKDEDEVRKRITAALISGVQAMVIDNIESKLDSPALNTLITEDVWTDRLLQVSRMITMEIRMITAGTGNNPAMRIDTARRTARIRIEPKVDMPFDIPRSTFKHPNLKSHVREIRGDLVWAALTIIRGWINADKKVYAGNEAAMGSFEDWRDVLGGICEFVEATLAPFGRMVRVRDREEEIPLAPTEFLANARDYLAQIDTEGAKWRALVGGWWNAFKQRGVLASELFDLAVAAGFDYSHIKQESRHSAFGKGLTKQIGKVYKAAAEYEYEIVPMKDLSRAGRYSLRPIGGPESPAAKWDGLILEGESESSDGGMAGSIYDQPPADAEPLTDPTAHADYVPDFEEG